MLFKRWLSKVHGRPEFSSVRPALQDCRRKFKFTPRLESLEDRTLLSDGVLDPTFGTGGLVTTGLHYDNYLPLYNAANPTLAPFIFSTTATHQNSLAVQSDGKIVVAGVSQNANPNAFTVARFNPDGSLDATFGTNGLVTTNFPGSTRDQANAVAIQADGRIVVAGSTTVSIVKGGVVVPNNIEFGLVRYNSNGSVDINFGKLGFVTIDFPTPQAPPAPDYNVATAVAVQANGRIVVAGTENNNFAVARVYADGMQDSDFNGNGLTAFNIGLTVGKGHIPVPGSTDALTSHGASAGRTDRGGGLYEY